MSINELLLLDNSSMMSVVNKAFLNVRMSHLRKPRQFWKCTMKRMLSSVSPI